MKHTLILVNKEHGLSKDYKPFDLVKTDNNENNFHGFLDPKLKPMVRREVLRNFKKLRREAMLEKLNIAIDNGYRSSEYQAQLMCRIFDDYLAEFGNQDIAYDKTMARVAMPGKSEHQTGLAFDMGYYKDGIYHNDVVDSQEAEWMAKNAHNFGFILRYPLGKEDITGYQYEPWHFRYVGVDNSIYIFKNNITFEEYHEMVLKKRA